MHVYFIQNPQIAKCLSERNAPSSEARSDIFNDARWLYESTEVSFDAYRIIHESSPIQQGGFFIT